MSPDRFQNTLHILKYFVVPESQDSIPLSFQPAFSDFVSTPMYGVLTAVQFHNDLPIKVYKIDNVGPDRMLSAELEVLDLLVPQPLPNRLFCFSRTVSENPAHLGHLVPHARPPSMDPHLTSP